MVYGVFFHAPSIIRNGCHEKGYRQPAPSGRVAAKYPPTREWAESRASRRAYFPSGMGDILAAMMVTVTTTAGRYVCLQVPGGQVPAEGVKFEPTLRAVT